MLLINSKIKTLSLDRPRIQSKRKKRAKKTTKPTKPTKPTGPKRMRLPRNSPDMMSSESASEAEHVSDAEQSSKSRAMKFVRAKIGSRII